MGWTEPVIHDTPPLYGINPATYALWQGQSMDCKGAPLTREHVLASLQGIPPIYYHWSNDRVLTQEQWEKMQRTEKYLRRYRRRGKRC